MAHIPSITNIPTIPIEFFIIDVEPNTTSAESLKAFPTTGINVDAAVFTPFAVNPSTLLVSVPSIESMLTKIVIITPRLHVTLDFKKLESFPICTLSDKFEIIPNDVAISVIGSITNVIVFPIKTTANIISGCINVTDAIFPCSRH